MINALKNPTLVNAMKKGASSLVSNEVKSSMELHDALEHGRISKSQFQSTAQEITKDILNKTSPIYKCADVSMQNQHLLTKFAKTGPHAHVSIFHETNSGIAPAVVLTHGGKFNKAGPHEISLKSVKSFSRAEKYLSNKLNSESKLNIDKRAITNYLSEIIPSSASETKQKMLHGTAQLITKTRFFTQPSFAFPCLLDNNLILNKDYEHTQEILRDVGLTDPITRFALFKYAFMWDSLKWMANVNLNKENENTIFYQTPVGNLPIQLNKTSNKNDLNTIVIKAAGLEDMLNNYHIITDELSSEIESDPAIITINKAAFLHVNTYPINESLTEFFTGSEGVKKNDDTTEWF